MQSAIGMMSRPKRGATKVTRKGQDDDFEQEQFGRGAATATSQRLSQVERAATAVSRRQSIADGVGVVGSSRSRQGDADDYDSEDDDDDRGSRARPQQPDRTGTIATQRSRAAPQSARTQVAFGAKSQSTFGATATSQSRSPQRDGTMRGERSFRGSEDGNDSQDDDDFSRMGTRPPQLDRGQSGHDTFASQRSRPNLTGQSTMASSRSLFNDNSPKRGVDMTPDNGESLKSYSNRLQQVVMQQHTARREDWGHFHAREGALLEEVGELRKYAEDRDSMRWYEAKLVEELRLERRKRIDLEARLTGADRWRTEAIAAGRMARNAEVNMSFGQEAELAEAREWQRNAERFRSGEERAMATERLAEDSLKRARQELGRKSRDLEKRSAEVELRSEASEAEALASAFRLSAELRNELDAVKTNSSGARPMGGQPSPARPVSQARRALEDIRGVRERVDGMLSGYPM